MRRIITMALMALGLTGGVALADGNRERREAAPTVRDHRGYDRGFQQGFSRNRGYDRGYDRGYQRGERVERRDDRREERGEHFRDFNRRPEIRFERHENRAGMRWVAGDWQWDGYEWQWVPGHYVRAYYGWGY